MKEEQLSIKYLSFAQRDELSSTDKELLDRASEVIGKAYAPYSHFMVASALRLANGTVLTGTNQENASYGLSLCAEQNVLAQAGSGHGHLAIESMAITVGYEEREIDYPISPCGACRQVIREHEVRHNRPIRIILQGASGDILIFNSVTDLLPFSFTKRDLIEDS